MFTPLNKRVLVKPKEAKTMTKGGLHIPDSAKEKPQVGEIVAIAPNCEGLDAGAIGRMVMYGKYAGTPVELDREGSEEKEKYLILAEKELLGVL